MCTEFYIAESTGSAPSPVNSISTMRIVEVQNELLYSEVLVDKEGRIPLFNLIDRNSPTQKKGIIIIERNRYKPGREYFLEKNNRPPGLALNINGEIYILKYKPIQENYNKVYFSGTQILFKKEPTWQEEPEEIEQERTVIYPDRKREEIVNIITAEFRRKVTQVHTKILNTNGEITYILGVHGWKIDNGIDKKVSLILISKNITSDLVMQSILKYNMYLNVGFKEIIQVKREVPIEKNFLLQDMQIGHPVVNLPSFYFDLIYHVLLEHRILMVSQDHNIIVNFVQSILASILPYKWKGVLMATIPEVRESDYKKLIETTIPYLIGICATRSEIRDIHRNRNIPEKTVIAYLDEDRIVVHAKTKEKKSIFNKLYKNTQNRRSIPFYKDILRETEIVWPTLKDVMNIIMIMISAETCEARDKVIRKFLKEKAPNKLKNFINGYSDHSKHVLSFLPRNKEFYAEFLETTLYHGSIKNEYIDEVKDDGLQTKELVTIIWITAYVALEGVKKTPNSQEIRFIVEAYITEYLTKSYQAAYTLLINLLCVLSSLGMYDMIMYISEILNTRGVELADELCASLVPMLPAETVKELRAAGSFIIPWNKKPVREKKKHTHSYRKLWSILQFTPGCIEETLRKYICISTEKIEKTESEYLTLLLDGFDEYELPY